MSEGDLIRPADLIAAGATTAEARRRVASLSRLAKGAYADVADLDPAERHLIMTHAVLSRLQAVVVSHTSSALLWGLPLRQSDYASVHMSPTSARRGHPKAGRGYHVHTRPVAPQETTTLQGLPTTNALRTVVDCATTVSGDWAIVIGDAALRRGLLSQEELDSSAARVRRIKGAQRVRALATLCSARSESPGESLLRLRLQRMGLDFVEQYEVPGVEGLPRVDFLVAGRLVIEFDGRAKYEMAGDPARAHWEEKRRHDRIVEAGYTVIRVVWSELWDEATLRRRINQALARSGR